MSARDAAESTTRTMDFNVDANIPTPYPSAFHGPNPETHTTVSGHRPQLRRFSKPKERATQRPERLDYGSLDQTLDFDLRGPLLFARLHWVLIDGLVNGVRTYSGVKYFEESHGAMFTFVLIYTSARGNQRIIKESVIRVVTSCSKLAARVSKEETSKKD